MADLARIVAQRELPAAHAEEDSPPPSAEDDPDAVSPPAEETDPGQDTLPPEEEPPAGEEESPPESEEEPDLSQSDETELQTALQSLSPQLRKQWAAVLKESPGEIPRIAKLIAKSHEQEREFAETVEGLQKRIEDMETRTAAPAPDGVPNKLPKRVADLKTPGEVKAREVTARNAVRELQRFLRRNPDGGEIAGQEFTAEQIHAAVDTWEEELDALPQRAEQLRDEEQAKAAKLEAKTQFQRDYAWANDPGHPKMVAARERMSQFPHLQNAPCPEYWASVIDRGVKAMDAERQGQPAEAAKPAARAPVSKVPPGKPHSAPGGAVARVTQAASVEAALKSVKETGSPQALADLLKATGR